MRRLTLPAVLIVVLLTLGPSPAEGDSMARTFGSAGDKITVSSIAAGNARTYSVWIYQTGFGESNNGRIFSVRNPSQIQLFTQGDGKWQFQALFSTTNGTWRFNTPTLNGWHHIALVYDHSSSANNPIAYVDGISVSVSEDGSPSGTSTEATGNFIVGNVDTPSRSWAGDLDEPAVWDTTLTAAEVGQLAGGVSPLDIQSASLLLYIPFAGNSPEVDLSPNGNDGAVTGTSTTTAAPFLVDTGYELAVPGALHSWWTTPLNVDDGTNTFIPGVEQAGNSVIQSSSTGRFNLGALGDDDHEAAALIIPTDAVPLAFYSNHASDTTLRYRKGTTIGDVSTLGSEQTLTAANVVTYHQVWRDGDNLWWVHRINTGATTEWLFRKSTNYATSWGSEVTLLDDADIYITSTQIGSIVRCALHAHPTATENRIFYFEVDLTTGAIDNVDGTNIANLDGTNLPLTFADLDAVFTPSGSDDARLFAVSDRAGGPEIVLTTWTTDSDGVYRVTEWDGAAWNSASVTTTGTIFGHTSGAHYAAGAAFPHNTPGGVIYLAKETSGTWTVEVWEDDAGWTQRSVVATSTGHKLIRPWPINTDQFTFGAVSIYPSSNGYENWENGNLYLADPQSLPSLPVLVGGW